MKIIKKDNLDRYVVSDILIAENLTEFWAERICSFLNEEYAEDFGPDFFAVEKDEYLLYIYNPND